MQLGIFCQKCGFMKTMVKDSRATEFGIWRQRACAKCDHRFTTYEYTLKEREHQDDAVRHALGHTQSSLASLSKVMAARVLKGEGT